VGLFSELVRGAVGEVPGVEVWLCHQEAKDFW